MSIHNYFNKNLFKKELIFFTALYFSLIIGFLLGENSSGGAFLDYLNQKKISQNFSNDFFETLLNYEKFPTRHSPILIIFLSVFEKLNLNDYFIRIIHLHLCLLLPLFFYLSLKLKFIDIDKRVLILITGIIFLSPTFRSLAIWPDSRVLGLSFFCISVYYYLNFINEKKFTHCLFNVFFYAFASYLSPNFSVFSLFFLYKYLSYFNFSSYKFVILTLLNFLLALPAFYYVFILDINFILKPAAVGVDIDIIGKDEKKNIFFSNLANHLLIIPSIVFFYIFPLILLKIISLKNILDIKKIIITSLILFISIIYFNYEFSFTGGGIFFKLSNYLFENNILFYIFSFIGILVLINVINLNFENFLLILILFLSNPQITIYHKYYDPLILLMFLLLFKIEIKLKNIKNLKQISFIYMYFAFFLLLNFLKSNV